MTTIQSPEQLVGILKRTEEYLLRSDESHWASIPLQELLHIVATNIRSLQQHSVYDRHAVTELFLPTGALQETAIANGWETGFLQLASTCDAMTSTRKIIS